MRTTMQISLCQIMGEFLESCFQVLFFSFLFNFVLYILAVVGGAFQLDGWQAAVAKGVQL